MKRLSSLLLALVLIASLAACGSIGSGGDTPTQVNDTPASTEEFVDKATEAETAADSGKTAADSADRALEEKAVTEAAAYLEGILGSDLKKYAKKDIDPENSVVNISYSWDTSASSRPDQNMPMDVTFDGLHIQSDTTADVLINAGFVLSQEDEEIEPNHYAGPFNCEVKGGRRLYLYLSNNTDSIKKAKECTFHSIHFLNGVDGVDYQGITDGSSVSDAIVKLGIPVDSIYIGYSPEKKAAYIKLSYGHGYNSACFDYEFISSKNDSEIFEMRIG